VKPIERGEVLGLADYETIRARFRARVIEEKRKRRVALGPTATCVFENRDTVLLQIQEMLRTERITREAAIAHEMETYNQLLPGDHELSATIMIEIDEKEERERFLREAKGLEGAFAIEIDGHRCKATHDPSREHPERTTAVHYVKFPLSPEAERALRENNSVKAALLSDHPRYAHRTELPPELVRSLAEDLA
jgi:hypothetical protein